MSETESVPPPPPVPAGVPGADAKNWMMASHLAGFLCFALGPFVVYSLKKDQIPAIIPHAKAAINFQLVVLIAWVAIMVVVMIPVIGKLAILAWPLLALADIVLMVMNALKAGKGEAPEYYIPIQFMK